jgi:hypothetical protein
VFAGAIVVLLLVSVLASASEPLKLFGGEPQAVRTYTSKPPALLPERVTGQPLDIFTVTPSPSVADLKAMAEQRKVDEDRPVAVGCMTGGVVTNYEEAYRLHLKTRKPLTVFVGQPPHVVKAAGAEASAQEAIICVIEPGADGAFRSSGIHRFDWAGRPQTIRLPPVPPMSPCGGGNCSCPPGGCPGPLCRCQ